MIVVKVELHSAITGLVTEIGRMTISNIGGTRTSGNYLVRLMRRGTTDRVLREGSVQGHARLAKGVWKLVASALTSVGH